MYTENNNFSMASIHPPYQVPHGCDTLVHDIPTLLIITESIIASFLWNRGAALRVHGLFLLFNRSLSLVRKRTNKSIDASHGV